MQSVKQAKFILSITMNAMIHIIFISTDAAEAIMPKAALYDCLASSRCGISFFSTNELLRLK